ncbi:hypothetical protein N665_1058s0002 [Sinapis alba]|nr:hypothetical protein N665_1058s0002 [Sinapis alba]
MGCFSIKNLHLPTKKIIPDKPFKDIKKFYTLQEKLGEGQFSITRKCEEKSEDQDSVHLVMELCGGKVLFDKMASSQRHPEKDAAGIIKQIVNVVHPENFLLSSNDENAMLKAIDFRCAVFIKEGEVYKDRVGTGHYGKEADIWSAGVVLYILLCGQPPFVTKLEEQMLYEIQNAPIDFESHPWPCILSAATDLVKKMLIKNPKKRITAAKVLDPNRYDPKNYSFTIIFAYDKPIDSVVSTRLKQFGNMNKLKKVALKVMEKNLSEEEIKGLKTMFNNIDTHKSGTLTQEELKRGLTTLGSKVSETEVKQLIEAADVVMEQST